ncbi:MAG: response regulator [Myxacorys californica WJT36-NPBG1]|nr:response regulator [Myxacorys californica WJT36-NPBG1]
MLSGIVGSITDALLVLDKDWRYIFASEEFLRRAKLNLSDLIGNNVWDLFPDAVGNEAYKQLHRAMAERITVEYEIFYEPFQSWFLDKAYPTADGGLAIYSRDITDRKQAELERERLLGAEQQARSAAEAAREEAQAANRIKDEFLAVLSHELRSPLNPILGWAKLLRKGNLDAIKTTKAITTIERNAKLQSELIEDLLDVSRILQGKLSLNVVPIHLASTIQAAIETVRLAAEARSITIEADLDSKVGPISGDSTRLQQIVWNLLSNAVKFTPTGGRVEVRLAEVNDQAEITISDNGKGIPANFLPYVFDYFRQEDGATTRKFGGLGLGLAIVRHLVELHGGTVQVESPGEGLGATFTVQLPLMPIPSTVNPDQPSSKSSFNLDAVRVLVIDDELDSLEFVAFVLEQVGAIVTTVSTASEGFWALTQSQPDVLLSDIGMPDMDGYMLMRQIRALPPEQGGQVKAIALTAYAGEVNEKQARQAGFQQHLSKPVEPDLLVQVVMTVLEKHD